MFTRDEIVRYSRQMILPEVGGIGQARLRGAYARAGSELEALYFAGAGVGVVEVPTREMADAARALNPLVEVRVVGGAPTGNDDAIAECERSLAFMRSVLAP